MSGNNATGARETEVVRRERNDATGEEEMLECCDGARENAEMVRREWDGATRTRSCDGGRSNRNTENMGGERYNVRGGESRLQ